MRNVFKHQASRQRRVSEIEGKNAVGTLVRGQQAYHLENDRFTSSMSDMEIDIESDYHTIKIVKANAEETLIEAKATDKNLSSFYVSVTYKNGSYDTCISDSMSKLKEGICVY